MTCFIGWNNSAIFSAKYKISTFSSGADIEGVVRDGIEYAFANDSDAVSTKDILFAIQNTNSLSVIMKEPLEKMTKEYERRKLKNASR